MWWKLQKTKGRETLKITSALCEEVTAITNTSSGINISYNLSLLSESLYN